MAFKVKVSKEGYSATSLATADKDLVFSSDWLTLRIIDSPSVQLTGEPDNLTGEYEHGLDYIPLVWAFIQDENGAWLTNANFSQTCLYDSPPAWNDVTSFNMNVDDTKVYVSASINGTGDRSALLYIFDKFI